MDLYFSCPVNFLKCPNSYCIPIDKMCNNDRDCPMGEDEPNCGKCYISYAVVEIYFICLMYWVSHTISHMVAFYKVLWVVQVWQRHNLKSMHIFELAREIWLVLLNQSGLYYLWVPISKSIFSFTTHHKSEICITFFSIDPATTWFLLLYTFLCM